MGTIATPALAAPDFQITINPASQSLSPGTSVSFVVGIGSIDGFSDPVDLSVSGLPPTVTAFFSPNPVTPPGNSFLTLSASEDAEDGTFPLTITATGGGITHVADGQATVDFGLIPICYGAFEGTVTDRETGLPIAGVRVWGSPEVLTDDAGHYRIEHLALGENNSPTEYFLRATKEPEYWWSDRQGILFCDQTTTVDFTMVRIRPARVSGTVFEGTVIPPDYDTVIPTTTPIEGVRVCVFDVPMPAGSDRPGWGLRHHVQRGPRQRAIRFLSHGRHVTTRRGGPAIGGRSTRWGRWGRTTTSPRTSPWSRCAP